MNTLNFTSCTVEYIKCLKTETGCFLGKRINIWMLFAEKHINNKIFDILLKEKPEL